MLYIPKKYPHLFNPHPRTSGVRLEEVGLFFCHIKNMSGIKNIPKVKMALQIVLNVLIILYQNKLPKTDVLTQNTSSNSEASVPILEDDRHFLPYKPCCNRTTSIKWRAFYL